MPGIARWNFRTSAMSMSLLSGLGNVVKRVARGPNPVVAAQTLPAFCSGGGSLNRATQMAPRYFSTTDVKDVASKFAVIEVKGHQYKVSPGDVIKTETVEGNVGDELVLSDVLLVGSNEYTSIGRPTVDGASVRAVLEEHTRTEKQIVFKKKRRKGYKRWKGHLQNISHIRITSVDHEP